MDELETIEEREELEGFRLRRDRNDVDELDRGAEAGMTTPDFRMADRENLGALLARSGSVGEAGLDAAGGGIVSAHSPLSLDGCGVCSEVEDALAKSDFGLCGSRREEEAQRPLSVADFRGVGRSRSTTDLLAKSSLGEGGGLSKPPAPVTQLALFFSLSSWTGSSST